MGRAKEDWLKRQEEETEELIECAGCTSYFDENDLTHVKDWHESGDDAWLCEICADIVGLSTAR